MLRLIYEICYFVYTFTLFSLFFLSLYWNLRNQCNTERIHGKHATIEMIDLMTYVNISNVFNISPCSINAAIQFSVLGH